MYKCCYALQNYNVFPTQIYGCFIVYLKVLDIL